MWTRAPQLFVDSFLDFIFFLSSVNQISESAFSPFLKFSDIFFFLFFLHTSIYYFGDSVVVFHHLGNKIYKNPIFKI
jgi:hypothetical protein